MKTNRQAFARHNTSIHQPPENRQTQLNKGNYKLKDWQKTTQQQQPSAVCPEASRAYRLDRGFSEYSMPEKLLFATVLLSALTTGKSAAEAIPTTSELCSKEKIFELFNIDGRQRPEPEYLRLYAEPGSMAAAIDDYVANKTPKPNNPIVEQLLVNNYLTYPAHLDIKYRVVNHSPGQIQTDPQPCPANAAITSEQQRNLEQHTYHAVQQAAGDISAHTQFNLYEANTREAAEVDIHINTCNNDGIIQGVAEKSVSKWEEVLQDEELIIATNTQDPSQERVENIIQAYRTRCNKVAIMLVPSHHQINDVDTLKVLATHEFSHALGLVDTYLYPQFVPYHPDNYLIRERTIMSYIDQVPASKKFKETSISSYPQSLMPYDIPALDMVANFIRQEQAEQEGTPVMPNPLPIKSPHRGDTKYYFTPGSNTIEVIDQRNDHTIYAYVMHPTRAGKVKRTLIDPEGYDTWDFRQYQTDLKIDMRPDGATIFNHSALTSSSMTSILENYDIVRHKKKAEGNIYLPASDDPNYLPERVLGGDGNDEIHGNALDNTFRPGNGNDVITGEKGEDDYVFQHGNGNTLTITDFDIKHDRLVLHPSAGVRNFRQLQRHIHKKNNGDLEIHLSGESKIVLNKMAGKKLRQKNFLAHPQYHKLK